MSALEIKTKIDQTLKQLSELKLRRSEISKRISAQEKKIELLNSQYVLAMLAENNLTIEQVSQLVHSLSETN
ncbi:MAG: hypothetical protein LBV19_08955 [Streptococcaceae bacterium]|jgi:hypothetical protein|nr:hypothetical protein [Streptococcaceae bacterium]